MQSIEESLALAARSAMIRPDFTSLLLMLLTNVKRTILRVPQVRFLRLYDLLLPSEHSPSTTICPRYGKTGKPVRIRLLGLVSNSGRSGLVHFFVAVSSLVAPDSSSCTDDAIGKSPCWLFIAPWFTFTSTSPWDGNTQKRVCFPNSRSKCRRRCLLESSTIRRATERNA